jgi:hypothetical protein
MLITSAGLARSVLITLTSLALVRGTATGATLPYMSIYVKDIFRLFFRVLFYDGIDAFAD